MAVYCSSMQIAEVLLLLHVWFKCCSCWCVTRHGKPVVKNTVSRFYYKKAGIRLQCVEIPPHRGERPPALPTTPQPPRGSGPILGPPVNDEGPVVISKGAAAVANIPIHFQILD